MSQRVHIASVVYLAFVLDLRKVVRQHLHVLKLPQLFYEFLSRVEFLHLIRFKLADMGQILADLGDVQSIGVDLLLLVKFTLFCC